PRKSIVPREALAHGWPLDRPGPAGPIDCLDVDPSAGFRGLHRHRLSPGGSRDRSISLRLDKSCWNAAAWVDPSGVGGGVTYDHQYLAVVSSGSNVLHQKCIN